MKRRWAALLPALLVPSAASFFYFVLLAGPAARAVYAAAKLFTLLWPLAARAFILGLPLPRPDALAPRHRRALAGGLAAGAALLAVLFALMASPLAAWVAAHTGPIRERALALGFLDHYLAFSLFLSLGNSLVEEYYWRWFVYGGLSDLLPGATAHLLAGAAFAAHHLVVTTRFFGLAGGLALGALVGLGGIFWSVMYRRQGSLAGAWLSHLMADLGILGVGHRLLFG